MTKEDQVIEKLHEFAQWSNRIPVIGLCGMGASGKTKLAKALNAFNTGVVDVSMDWWFSQSTMGHRSEISRARESRDPELIAFAENPVNRIAWAQFDEDFSELMLTGELKRSGMYNKADEGKMTMNIDLPGKNKTLGLIVLEGILVHAGRSRRFLDYTIVLDVPADELLRRRMKREGSYKTKEAILDRHQIEETYIRPAYAPDFQPAKEGPNVLRLTIPEIESLRAQLELESMTALKQPLRQDARYGRAAVGAAVVS